MHSKTEHRPVVLAIGGHDPGGGAGIQADIEAIGANGCHPATAITCLTVQDSCNVSQLIPLAAEHLTAQCKAVLDDCSVSAIKIGLLGSSQAADGVIRLLRASPQIPVILDPVLAAGGGSELVSEQLLDKIREELLPLCRLITPNTVEAARLSAGGSSAGLDRHAEILLQLGCGSVLITGTHDESDPNRVINRLYRADKQTMIRQYPRLPGEYHGSGCTLAAALAASIGRGQSLENATQTALDYSWNCLQKGYRTGRCQSIPNRWFETLSNNSR
ncbi:MAG: hydroxymethylpyrimidine/phosphomethylpyrimidine kinase [Candidatus Thiodiazotropha weberae]|uniref:hydroxymethylpyrimidine kinase n=1 Tax=Candidatus Thiodiazotropha endoloripes TaxID=1818881 RepID=A0A1E2UV71_9GAMM|nr:hydroxymethylpyrimidine/phosphomethylpyrimidine kinase [Candidatus Thiodiazotropha endoloripes]MCG7899919.1 hydroxymethylpyrimidine/phosphomethylpyrimidine kinase [Candidatus Thiodiazotropha weberae]MCG7901057.1 hydroxymethylpyrimidine/phosphomethylpyrimidine kinase [Candidatus Thiodiazotropha weberae]MCG7913344.1 hydroxymethylpyrimidine/phosphomethylpyrimidine kinase [Candidatus Thiodiazotropha weberae]ODB91716.1 hydroxymethylpyrimidine/phosphomethylpyrimidine kinase [Candidatus Thiodiazotr